MPQLKWNVSSISTVVPFGSSVGALYQKLYTQSKSAPENGANLSSETCRAELKRWTNEKVLHLVGYLHRCKYLLFGFYVSCVYSEKT